MDLYIGTPKDPNFQSDQVEIDNQIEQLMTQIETILFTNKGEVMGYPDFGCSLQDLVFKLNYNKFQIKEEINNQIARYCPLANVYNLSVDVNFTQGTNQTVAKVDVTINKKYYIQVNIN